MEHILTMKEFDEFMLKNGCKARFEMHLGRKTPEHPAFKRVHLADSNGVWFADVSYHIVPVLIQGKYLKVIERDASTVKYALDYKPCAVCGNHIYGGPKRSSYAIDTTGLPVGLGIGPAFVKRCNSVVCLSCAHAQDLSKIEDAEAVVFGFTTTSTGVPLEVTNDGMTIVYKIDKVAMKDKCAKLWYVEFRDHKGRAWDGVADLSKRIVTVMPKGEAWI